MNKYLESKLGKIFVLGLPRTGTTSICSTLLSLNYKVAHTAYTQATFNNATAIADTPIFNDYKALNVHYPQSQFIYLTRDAKKWVPSIKQLLLRMHHNVVRNDGGFNPIIKRCYTEVFAPFTIENIKRDEFLLACYQQHKAEVTQYFKEQQQPLLFIDVSNANDYQKLLTFLNKRPLSTRAQVNSLSLDSLSFNSLSLDSSQLNFPLLNKGGKVTAWKDLKHRLKIESTKNGRCSSLDHIK